MLTLAFINVNKVFYKLKPTKPLKIDQMIKDPLFLHNLNGHS